MIVKSFINHFQFVRLLRGDRNSFNASNRNLSYVIFSVVIWVLLVPIKFLDLFGFFYLFDFLRRMIFQTRKLSKHEIEEAKIVFGDAIDFDSIRIRERSWMAKFGAKSSKKTHLGFVLFRTINFSRDLNHQKYSSDMSWLIHELVHVLQFKYLGAQYIIEALRAQKKAGYDYKGQEGLKQATHLSDFNLEQQADIARDYYRKMKAGVPLSIYKNYILELRRGKF